jgi:hypothetical protein
MKTFKTILILAAGLLVLNSCKKKFENPPMADPPAMNGKITIDSIYGRFIKHYGPPSSPTATVLYRFSGDVNLECTVTADETSGNIYKTVFVEDSTGGLTVKLLNSGGLAVGDKIRINLNNVVLNDYGDMVQLDSIDIEKQVVKLSSGNWVIPTKMTFNQVNDLDAYGLATYQGRLVTLDSVEFIPVEKTLPFADALNKESLDRHIMAVNGNTMIVRSSGYSNFASAAIPCGKGSITVIVGQYRDDIQLTIRDYKEVKMNNTGCPKVAKDFSDYTVLSGGWSQQNVVGAIDWEIGSYDGSLYTQISNYTGSNNVCETWLISPSLDLSGLADPKFAFMSAKANFSGPVLEVLVSTNYNSGSPSSATWTSLSPTLSSGGYSWTSSGVISLIPYKSSNTRVAFKYTGTATNGATYEIDNIAVWGE